MALPSLACLKSQSGKYLSTHCDGTVLCGADSAGPDERFVVQAGGGGYSLRAANGKYVSAEPDSRIVATREVAQAWETFTLFCTGPRDGKCFLRTDHGHFVSAKPDGTVAGDATAPGPSETFTIEEAKPPAAAAQQMPGLVGHAFTIRVSGLPSLALGVADGSRLVLEEGPGEGYQRFMFDGTGLKAVDTGKVLNAREGPAVLESGADSGGNQGWTYNPLTREVCSTTEDLVLSVEVERLGAGAGVEVSRRTGGAHQRWELVVADAVAGPRWGIFRVELMWNAGLVLGISECSQKDEARLIVSGPTGRTNQQFRFVGDMIVALHSGKVLDAYGGLGAGAHLMQFGAHGGPNQRWVYDPTTQEIKATTQDLVFEIENMRLEPGTGVIAGERNSGLHQQWRLIVA
jgi:uncharacterized protein YndB with AHSA1/START domain